MVNAEFVITIDIDWAPDFAIHYAADLLIERQVKATWFVTHISPAVDCLRKYPELFELGIHPNFLPGSSHGRTPKEVLDHCMGLVPEARSLRTHALVQSTPLLKQVMTQTPINIDVSLFLSHMPHIVPIRHNMNGRKLLRIPYFWEDDFEMEENHPCWHLEPLMAVGKGMKVLDFHPIHIFLNSFNMQSYRALTKRVAYLPDLTLDAAIPHVQKGDGTRTLFIEAVTFLSSVSSCCIRDFEGQAAFFEKTNPM